MLNICYITCFILTKNKIIFFLNHHQTVFLIELMNAEEQEATNVTFFTKKKRLKIEKET